MKEGLKLNDLNNLRSEIDKINNEILNLLNKRAKIALEIGKEKEKHGQQIYDPIREQQIINEIIRNNEGPFSDEIIIYIFKEIFKASASLQEKSKDSSLLISRKRKDKDTVISIKNELIGSTKKTLVFGPCSIESYDQLESVAKLITEKKLKFIRGGAFKPRTSPYDFQGLGLKGLKMIKDISNKYDLISIVEVMDKEQLSLAYDYIDIIQIGARNMQNFTLLKELGKCNKPVLLKRGFSATIEELKLSAEYIISSGNENVILCERGIRTFENATRNTLDISAIPILKTDTHLPVIVDVSHSAGRKDIMINLANASLAAGADGIMAEVHPNPLIALSDADQQMDFKEFESFYRKINEL